MAENKPAGIGRIEYLDSLRGFTMLFVVLGHVTTFVNGLLLSGRFSLNDIITQFHMPMLFFISGFVLYKEKSVWDLRNTLTFLRKKIPSQIISPLLFMLLLAFTLDKSMHDMLFDSFKGGYWFTFSLFVFYALYALLSRVSQMLRLTSMQSDALLLGVAVLLYVLTDYGVWHSFKFDEDLSELFGVTRMQSFLFVVIGTRVKKYFQHVEQLLDSNLFISLSLAIFVLFQLPVSSVIPSVMIKHFIICLAGIAVLFAGFRKMKNLVSDTKYLGKPLQYIGRHTLDIYFIHYFFIFGFSGMLSEFIYGVDSLLLEFIVSLAVGIVVIALSLAISSLLRRSPHLAHWLFGAKMPNRA